MDRLHAIDNKEATRSLDDSGDKTDLDPGTQNDTQTTGVSTRLFRL